MTGREALPLWRNKEIRERRKSNSTMIYDMKGKVSNLDVNLVPSRFLATAEVFTDLDETRLKHVIFYHQKSGGKQLSECGKSISFL